MNYQNDLKNSALHMMIFLVSQLILGCKRFRETRKTIDFAFCKKMIWSTMYGTDLFNQVLTPQQQIEYGNTGAIEQDNNQSYSPKGTACD